MTSTPRWFTDTSDGHSQWYIERFRTMEREGVDLGGEARLVNALVPPGARVLDAGCGPGRIAARLHAAGHDVVGVDVDPALIAAAEEDHPGPEWRVADLATLDLPGDPFDLVVCAGNVMIFLAPGSERAVLDRLRAHVRPGGRIVLGFRTDRPYGPAALDVDAAAVGLEVEQRFATWDLVPYDAEADFAVTFLRVPSHPKDR
ncbi:class I SAM-dependent methyltransferase [Mumia zhuanghuii]|uniref:Class I SAM-dependent methyltransferase n=1 Tax=Mumia zhuanghuii TaxID=2585211 RepID=A0A5C4MAP9_9ACTN|nr:class I SAM-dependent methyltransferase [Mumia zhuanghuii]TNC33122.1 class I SAM-dependent methyltransferase [Mumia zhuanghuii]TNC47177.1 class I SAM-dependent methyltransferase [Mumia zhuanghuii]